MDTEPLFRATFALIFVVMVLVSSAYRRRARAEGGTIPRIAEGRQMLFLRQIMSLPLLLAIVLYVVAPGWLEWATFPVPPWARWAAALIAVSGIPFMVWVFRNIGKNVSETLLTKQSHQLVTSGPYRWIRHPLYTVALVTLLALGVLASNWFIVVYALAGIVVFRFAVIPREEANLIQAFGAAYEAYRRRTGAMFPRMR